MLSWRLWQACWQSANLPDWRSGTSCQDNPVDISGYQTITAVQIEKIPWFKLVRKKPPQLKKK